MNMYREIKFRAWDKNRTGAYNYVVYQNDQELWEYFRDLNDDERRYGCKFILMHNTGLKDKNGKEIYEGDILKNTVEETVISIRWDETSASWCFDELNIYMDDGVGRGDWRFTMGVAKNCEVIGNIFENPELLEGKAPNE